MCLAWHAMCRAAAYAIGSTEAIFVIALGSAKCIIVFSAHILLCVVFLVLLSRQWRCLWQFIQMLEDCWKIASKSFIYHPCSEWLRICTWDMINYLVLLRKGASKSFLSLFFFLIIYVLNGWEFAQDIWWIIYCL